MRTQKTKHTHSNVRTALVDTYRESSGYPRSRSEASRTLSIPATSPLVAPTNPTCTLIQQAVQRWEHRSQIFWHSPLGRVALRRCPTPGNRGRLDLESRQRQAEAAKARERLSAAAVASVGFRRERDEAQTRSGALVAELAESQALFAKARTDLRSVQAELEAAKRKAHGSQVRCCNTFRDSALIRAETTSARQWRLLSVATLMRQAEEGFSESLSCKAARRQSF